MKKLSRFAVKYSLDDIDRQLKYVFSQANDYEYNEGLRWYQEANLYLQEISNHFNLPISLTCALCACLSPNASWNQNVKDTYTLIRFKAAGRFKVTTYFRNKQKAKQIFKTKDTSLLSGRKVLPFFDNLLRPQESTEVTIDTHIVRCSVNNSNLEVSYIPPTHWNCIKETIEGIAKENNLLPLQVQAILWITWKRLTLSRDTSLNQKFFMF